MRNEWAFKSRYAIMKRRNVVIPGQFNRDGSVKTRSFQQIVDWRLTEELQNKVKPYSYRIRAEDCLDLPEKSYHPRYVPLTSDQKRMIKEMKLFGHAAIGGTDKFVTIDAVIKMITRRLQINCGYVMDDERVLQEVPENRTNALMELLADYAGKAIIWVPWHPPLKKVLDRITKEYGPDSVAQWHGGNRATRHEDERRFLNDPNCRFMVATQGAGMRGNTWTVAGVAIYYANNYDLEQRDQSERRNWRIGQKNTVRYYDLIAEDDDIDMKVLKNLRAKINVATMMNQEDFRKWLI
jgi:SNF2 family DNA or RNA helicase